MQKKKGSDDLFMIQLLLNDILLRVGRREVQPTTPIQQIM